MSFYEILAGICILLISAALVGISLFFLATAKQGWTFFRQRKTNLRVRYILAWIAQGLCLGLAIGCSFGTAMTMLSAIICPCLLVLISFLGIGISARQSQGERIRLHPLIWLVYPALTLVTHPS